MAKAKIETNEKAQQIDYYEAYKGADALQMVENESMHYDARIDRQIRIPIPNVHEYLDNLKGKE